MAPLIFGLVAAVIGESVVGFIVATIITSFVISKVQSLLSPSKAKSSTLAAQQVTINDTVSPRITIYGEIKTSGTVAFLGTSGTNNKFLWVVIDLADHQCESITDIWLDGLKINNNSIGTSTGLVTGGTPPWNGKLYIWKHLGTYAQTVDTNLQTAFPSWDAAHKLSGLAYIVIRMERDPEVFINGAPENYFARVRGRHLYDPRKDSTNGGSGVHRYYDPKSWEWSANPALAAADYIFGGCVWHDFDIGNGVIPNPIPDVSKRGLKELPTRIDWTQVSVAANFSDNNLLLPLGGTEKRYSCNGALSADLPHGENMARLLSAMGGAVVYTGGKYRIFCAQYDTPTLSIGDNDLTGEYQVETSVGDNAVINAVSAVYFDATRDWQPVTSYMRTNPGYETFDGRRVPSVIELPTVTSETQAQRLCEIENRQARNQTVITISLGLNGFKLKTWDTFFYTNSELGYVNKVFRVTHWQLDSSGPGVKIIARDEYATTYPEFAEDDFSTPTITGLGNQFELPDAPTALQTTSLVNAILVQWEPPATVFANTSYEVQESGSSAMTSPVTVYQGKDRQVTLGKTVTTVYYYRVRAKLQGQVSDWNPSVGGVSGKALANLAVALSASVIPGSISAIVTGSTAVTISAVVTAAGGTGPYTYAWTWNSGGSGITITSASSASTTFSSTSLTTGEVRSGVARCTITDNVSATTTVDVAVVISNSTFLVTAVDVSTGKSGPGLSGTVSTLGKSPNVTPSGGTPGYTYAWVRLNTTSGANPTISSATAQNPTWTATVFDGTDCISNWRCTVTDTASVTAFVDVNVRMVWINVAAPFSVFASNVTGAGSGFAGSGNVNSSGQSPNTTPSGGTPPYFFAWTLVVLNTAPLPTIPTITAQNPVWSAIAVVDGTPSLSTWKVTCTDSAGLTATATMSVQLHWTNLS